MKINYSPKPTESGTALLVALFLCMILAVTIAGYLKHSQQQNFLSMRSQTWNLTIAVSEAGVEEALQHLNANANNLEADGWTKSGSTYAASRTLNSTTRYTVTIDNENPLRPVITSQAFINEPGPTANGGTSPLLAAIGTTIDNETVVPVRPNTISRAVRVTAGRSGLFLKAMVAKHTIDMNGNGVLTDSFNSTDPRYSTNGRYPAGVTAKLLDNGDVASNDSIINGVNIWNANIYGRVAVGPKGTISVGPNGGVGTRAWQAMNDGVQPGYFTDDMNFTFPNVTLPYTTGSTPEKNVTISTTNYTLSSITNTVMSATYPSPVPDSGVTSNVTYVTVSSPPSPPRYGTVTNILTTETSSFTLPAAETYVGTVTKQGSKWYYDKITGYNYTYPSYTYTYSTELLSTNFTVSTVKYDYVIQGSPANMPPQDYYVDSIPNGTLLVRGNARLVVRNNIKMSGQDAIILDSTGKLEMWVGGSSVDLSGQGVMNHTGYAQNFILWCADSVTDLKYSGNGEFVGIVVAPNADVALSGGGNADQDYVGALIASTIRLNGHYSFHYDEALRNYRGSGRYLINQWNEIPVSSIVVTAR